MAKQRKLSREKREALYHSVIPIASRFRKEFLDDTIPIKDTFQTLEQLGFFIVRFPTHNNLSGFHLKKSDYDCIFINSSHPLSRQYFSGWHECYHAYTGEGGGISLEEDTQLDEIEYKAECFAGCILMPEHLVSSYIREKGISLSYPSYDQLVRMQNYFRVSLSALLTRLIQIYPEHQSVLSKRFALTHASRLDDMKEVVRRVNGDIELILPSNEFSVSPRFYVKLHENLSADRITAAKAESILDLIEKVREKYGV
ncbi:ImmA/IrrE family metallo-endopeptidase [Paenibacillus sp. 3LSP]|uniref:ImmA/IrrE family metallo-endopeptidase n=1 Tax=Paenibacillus sp. 3LSP TaxID=2800795 RepID=UPI0028FD2CAE|nr:ImmA/IrrE family metallo-endopeptidase [Paenibacillus sp. 3LSP]MDU0331790.1 ImmA/IrrE family metallo-endopeptidase [Paenibacillus sp. 3LSP]